MRALLALPMSSLFVTSMPRLGRDCLRRVTYREERENVLLQSMFHHAPSSLCMPPSGRER